MKELCKIKPALLDNQYEELIKAVKKPKYICSKCVRVAKKKSQLCKPEKI